MSEEMTYSYPVGQGRRIFDEKTFPKIETAQDLMALGWKTAASLAEIPALPSVYILVNKFTNEIEYIGQSSKTRYRLANTMHPAYSPDLHKISYLPVEEDEKDLRYYIEYMAIRMLNPLLNRRNGFYPMGNEANLDASYHKLFD